MVEIKLRFTKMTMLLPFFIWVQSISLHNVHASVHLKMTQKVTGVTSMMNFFWFQQQWFLLVQKIALPAKTHTGLTMAQLMTTIMVPTIVCPTMVHMVHSLPTTIPLVNHDDSSCSNHNCHKGIVKWVWQCMQCVWIPCMYVQYVGFAWGVCEYLHTMWGCACTLVWHCG